MVEITFFTAATEVESPIGFKIKGPYLVNASHSKDKCVSVYCYDVPWTGQSLCFRRFVSFFIETLFSGSNHGQYFFRRKIDLSNRMIFRVADIDEVLVLSEYMAQSLWMVELNFLVVTIDETYPPVANLCFEFHSFLIDDYDSVIA